MGESIQKGSQGHKAPRNRGTRLWLVCTLPLFCFAFYALTGTGHSSSGDGFLIFLTARNLLQRGHLAIADVPGTGQLRRPGTDGKLYAKFGPGLMIAHIPTLMGARLARHLHLLRDPLTGTEPKSLREDEFWTQFTNAWIAAAVVALVFLLCEVFGAEPRSAATVALLVALASPLWLYARVDATEALQSLGITGAVVCLASGLRSSDGRGRDLAAGTFYAVTILAKLFNVILIPAFLLFFAMTWRKRSSRWAPIVFALPVALSLLAHGSYNLIRFGSPIDTGYDLSDERFSHALIPGVLSILFSPSYGLLLFWPAVLIAVAGVRRHFTRFPEESVLMLSIFATLLCAYATWWAYQGIYYGPRFVVPTIPLLATFTLPVVRSGTRRAKVALVAAFLFGFSVQALAATTSHWQQIVHGIFWSIECKTTEDCLDNPEIAPLRIATWYLRALYWRDREPDRAEALLRVPPWHDAVPWRNPDEAVDKLKATLGVDFWAAPERWRLPTYYLWIPGAASGIPSSRVLTAVLCALTVGAAVALLRVLVVVDPASNTGRRWSGVDLP